MDERGVCFTETEAFLVAWVLAEALGHALGADALSDAAMAEEAHLMVRHRIDDHRRGQGGELR